VPSAGLIGLVAMCLAIVGVVCLFRVDWRWGLSAMLAVLVVGPTIFFFALQVFPSTPLGRKLIGSPPGSEGGAAAEREGEQGLPPSLTKEFEAMIDTEGEAATDLRPSGFVRIGGKRVAAMSEISFVNAGTRVRVTGADGMGVRVRPV